MPTFPLQIIAIAPISPSASKSTHASFTSIAPTPKACMHMQSAHCIVAAENILQNLTQQEQQEFLPLSKAMRNNFLLLRQKHADGKRIVILCYADPLYFGIAATLLKHFAPNEIHTHTFTAGLSMLQNICHMAGIPWHNVRSVSLHGRHTQKDWQALFVAVFSQNPVCILTDARTSTQHIAQNLLERGAQGTLFVLEKFLSEDMYFTHLSLHEAAHNASRETKHPCTLLYMPKKSEQKIHLGLAQKNIAHEKNLITKPCIRATALSLLQLQPHSCLWDVGAGSGALSLEACALAYEGHIIAIEHNKERCEQIKENRRTLAACILDIHEAKVPHNLENLPKPQRIFVGGGLYHADISNFLNTLTSALEPSGKMVISCVLMGSVQKVQKYFAEKKWQLEILQMQVHHGQNLGDDVRLVPENPVFLLSVQKPLCT